MFVKRFAVAILCLAMLSSSACTATKVQPPVETKATVVPTEKATQQATVKPTATKKPTTVSTEAPTQKPNVRPSPRPTVKPTTIPTTAATVAPTTMPATAPSTAPAQAATDSIIITATTPGIYYIYKDNFGNSYQIPEGEDFFDYTLSRAELPAVTSQFPVLEQLIYEKTNAEREKQGLGTLDWEEKAYFFANTRAYESSILWDHTRPNGESYDHIFAQYSVLCNNGENLYSYYHSDLNVGKIATSAVTEALAKSAIDGWMNSPGHRANMLKETWTSMVVGVYYDEQAHKLFAVQLFFE